MHILSAFFGVEEITGGEIIQVIALILANICLLILFISTKLSFTAYIAWMVENRFKQPSEKDMQRLIRWCLKKYLDDLIGKS